MDDIVQQAMAKWPNVPDVYGWLSLSRRGEWRIKGEKISNPIVSDFISRNYAHDDQGRWFFQNGPQRVFVLLDYTPMVYRLSDTTLIESHTGIPVSRILGAYIDDGGSLLLETEAGVGIVDDRDLDKFLSCLSDAAGHRLNENVFASMAQQAPHLWRGLFLKTMGSISPIENVLAADLPQRFRFDPDPRQADGKEECY